MIKKFVTNIAGQVQEATFDIQDGQAANIS